MLQPGVDSMAQREIPQNLLQLQAIVKERPLKSWHVEKETPEKLELRISFGSETKEKSGHMEVQDNKTEVGL